MITALGVAYFKISNQDLETIELGYEEVLDLERTPDVSAKRRKYRETPSTASAGDTMNSAYYSDGSALKSSQNKMRTNFKKDFSSYYYTTNSTKKRQRRH